MDLGAISFPARGESEMPPCPPRCALVPLSFLTIVITAIYKRIRRQMEKEYRLIFELNKHYLPDEVYFSLLDNC